MKRRFLFLAVFLAVTAQGFTAESSKTGSKSGSKSDSKTESKTAFKPNPSRFALKDGDTVVFLGDDSTHQCLYTQYLEDFFYTRFPDQRIRFHNAGVKGDTVGDALARFDEDVAAAKPKYVTVLLGMHDGQFTNFDAQVFGVFEKDMLQLLFRAQQLGSAPVLMTPTIYDSLAARLNHRNLANPHETYYNATLAYFGSWMREMAITHGLGFVDLHGPLNDLTFKQRRSGNQRGQFSLVPDSVHPNASGHAVMAAAILEDMMGRKALSSIAVHCGADGEWQHSATNGMLSDFKAERGLRFTFKANSLPWVLPPEAAEGYKLARAGPLHSAERVIVTGLAPGTYTMTIDGSTVGTYSNAELARGVELQENNLTPQYQQALKVANFNKQRNDKAIRPARNLWQDLKGRRDELWLTSLTDPEQAESKREEFNRWHDGFKKRVAKLDEQARDIEDEIYGMNRPLPRTYEIQPIELRANARRP